MIPFVAGLEAGVMPSAGAGRSDPSSRASTYSRRHFGYNVQSDGATRLFVGWLYRLCGSSHALGFEVSMRRESS
jgi:hypothetical protein